MKKIEVEYAELLALGMLCAAEGVLQATCFSPEKTRTPQEFARTLEEKVRESVEISWNRDRSENAKT